VSGAALTPTGGKLVPLSRVRAITAERMMESTRSVARLTLFMEARFAAAAKFRATHAPAFEQQGHGRLSYDVMVAKACALAIETHPDFNTEWADGALRHHDGIHIAFAVQAPRGLLVPVLRDANRRSLSELARDGTLLIERARAGKLSLDEMTGATFTISNLGGQGVDAFTPIVNPPQAAILGVGKIAPRAVVVDGSVQAIEAAWLCLSFDHRIVDGAPAADFLQHIRDLLESPDQLLNGSAPATG
jgi:pyruvate dehydrogenase E2 component (dihydrolipoamide acetyltransferase)